MVVVKEEGNKKEAYGKTKSLRMTSFKFLRGRRRHCSQSSPVVILTQAGAGTSIWREFIKMFTL